MEELNTLASDDLRATLVRCETNIKESEEAKEASEQLQAAQAAAKLIAEPFADAIKYQRAKQRFAALCLDDNGAVS